jgi:murein DD-endopeptidase MepM/ murein hydrolase activator NlpD
MNPKHTKQQLEIALLTAALSVGCLAEPVEPSEESHPEQVEMGPVSMLLVDDPVDDLAHVWVGIERVDLRPCNGGGWTRIPVGGTFDLLALRYGAAASLADEVTVPVGKYCELRLVSEEGAILEFDDGITEDVVFPSGTSSGIKIKTEFEVRPGVLTRIKLDWDAGETFKQSPNGDWKGDPVIRTAEIDYVAPSASPYAGATMVAQQEFTVFPDVESTWDLAGGGSLAFPVGAVQDEVMFTATTWSPASSSYSGVIYEFEPAYVFDIAPVLTKSVSQTEGGESPQIVLDGVGLPTMVADANTVTAEIPHFSDACVDEAFADVPTSSFYYPYITFLKCQGVVKGKQNGNFDPNGLLTRAELLKVALDLAVGTKNVEKMVLDSPGDYPMPFSDVPNTHWARSLIRYGDKVGLISGDQGADTFRPDDPVNRAEAAKMFVEASAHYSQVGFTGSAQRGFQLLNSMFYSSYAAELQNSPFNDVAKDAWFFRYAVAMRAANAIAREAEFQPNALVTRKEMAQMAYLLGSGFTDLRLRLFCPAVQPIAPSCVTLLSEKIKLSQMYLEYYVKNPTGDHLHGGLDFGGSWPIYSPTAGTVRRVTAENQCGVLVIEDSDNSTERHIFLHMEGIVVSVNDQIKAGDYLGKSGSSEGLKCVVEGSHLHYEIRKNTATNKPVPSDNPNGLSTAELTHNPLDFDF